MDNLAMKIDVRINHDSHTPVTLQIVTRISRLIRTGRIKAGSVLPSVRDAGDAWGVNFTTVQRAYTLLKDCGLVVPNRSRRMQVNQTAPVMTPTERAAHLLPILLHLRTQARELGVSDAELHVQFAQVFKPSM